MNKRMREIRQEIANKKAEARQLTNENKITEAKALVKEIQSLEDEYEIEETLLEDSKKTIDNSKNNGKIEYNSGLFAKVVKGEKLSGEEAELVQNMTTIGENGESLLIPKDVLTKIYELKRQYKSARSIVGHYPTTTLEGSYPIESLETLTELTNFTEEDDVPDSDEPKFTNVTYKIKEYGAILPLSNTLLKNEAAGLVNYISRWFAKKAVRTENKLIFESLKKDKVAKSITSMDDIRRIINKEVDASILPSSVIVTNQDGFDFMDAQKDATGRSLLQPDPTNATRRMYKGLPIEVYSNAELPNVTGKAPMYIGDMTEAEDLVEREGLQFAMSSEAGFKQNKTYIRVIESIDVAIKDKGAYVYGEITLP